MEFLLENNDNTSISTEFTFTKSDLDSQQNTLTGGKLKYTFNKVNLGDNNISAYSENSQNSENNENSIVQNGGGLFCSDDFNNILLESLSDGRPDIACYLLCKTQKLPKDITKKDKMGRNILHYLSIYASHGNIVLHITRLVRKVSKNKLKTALKTQDKLGNTPLHYATELGFNNLVKLYIDNGADPKIRNKEGVYVDEDDTPIDVSIIIASDSNGSIGEVNLFNNNMQTNELFNPTEEYDTDSFIKEIQKSMIQNNNINDCDDNSKIVSNDDIKIINMPHMNMPHMNMSQISPVSPMSQMSQMPEMAQMDQIYTITNQSSNTSINTDILIDNILERVVPNSHRDNSRDSMLEISDEQNSVSTQDILNDIVTRQGQRNSQRGGSKSSKKSKKDSKKSKKDSKKSKKSSKISRVNMSMHSEISISSNASDISDIARQISRQSSDIHERSIQKIIKILKLDENNEKDVIKARNYKAYIYKTIKEKNPLLNNFDRAVEMEKAITADMLKSIDIDKVTKDIQKHLSEKSDKTESDKTVSDKTVSEKVKISKTTQKRIPEYNQNKIKYSLTSDSILSDSILSDSNLSDLSNSNSSNSNSSYSSLSEF